MCGIAVMVAPESQASEASLFSMVICQAHRGPDGQGVERIPLGGVTVGLGQRRLAILDLSPAGKQPMEHPGTGDVLVYKGELYNHLELRRDLESAGERFRGRSDTEVLLHALARWGPEVLRRLRGMFALAWFRRADRRLILARDPVGIKPLYTHRAPGVLLAASEVRAVLSSGLVERRVSRAGMASMLAFGAVQDPDTIFEGVRSFPAGCWQEFDLDALDGPDRAPVRYWRPPALDGSIDEREAVSRVRRTIDGAVRDHLMSDVPVGVFLSSGIDSTIVAGLASRHMPGIRAYTVGFADNKDLSETDASARTAAVLGLPHVDVQVTASAALGDAERWLGGLDQPSVDGLNTYIVSRAVKQAGITVALSGLGGDELFGGYRTFTDVPRLARLMRAARPLPWWVRVLAARAASVGRSEVQRAKLVDIARTCGSLADLYFQRRRVMSDAQLRLLGITASESGLTECMAPAEALAAWEDGGSDPVAAVSSLEMRFYAGNMLLRDSDTTGMASSLEVRVPFFDTGVLDAVMAIPGMVRLPKGARPKHLLRLAFADLLRDEQLSAVKRGFSLPLRRWMVGPLRPMCEETLADLKRSGLLRPEGIDAVWRSYLSAPESPAWSRAFSLVVLGAYLTRVGGGPGPARPGASIPTVGGAPLRTAQSA